MSWMTMYRSSSWTILAGIFRAMILLKRLSSAISPSVVGPPTSVVNGDDARHATRDTRHATGNRRQATRTPATQRGTVIGLRQETMYRFLLETFVLGLKNLRLH